MSKLKKEAPATPGETRRNQRSGDHQPNQGGETIISDDLDLEHCWANLLGSLLDQEV